MVNNWTSWNIFACGYFKSLMTDSQQMLLFLCFGIFVRKKKELNKINSSKLRGKGAHWAEIQLFVQFLLVHNFILQDG